MNSPDLMFEHALDVLKGWLPGNMGSLDYSAKLSDDVTFTVPRGRVAHIQQDGDGSIRFHMGVSGKQMAIFLTQGAADFDVTNPGTTASGLFMHQAIAPTGVLSGIVATGGYQVETTEFDTTRTYAPNELLTADADDTTLATGGVLDNKNSGAVALTVPWAGGGTTNAVCGVVCEGKKTNCHGVSVLNLWPIYLPGTT